MSLYRGVFLDLDSVHPGDLDLTGLVACVPSCTLHAGTLPERLSAYISDADLVITNKVVLDRPLLEANPQLKLICVAATGTDNVDLEAAAALGIAVCNVTGYATPSVVEHVFALLLALSRRLGEHARAASDGHWARSDQFCVLDFPFSELSGRTLGIIGYGELGRGVARVAEAFGMQVLIAQRPGGGAQAGRVPLHELLSAVDVLSLHVPLAENTRNLIGPAELALMKADAILINTARGGVVDEPALADALVAGRLGGAGIDVLSSEPPVAGNPLLAGDIPNLIVTPHVAWASREARQRLIDGVVQNVLAFQRGEPLNRIL